MPGLYSPAARRPHAPRRSGRPACRMPLYTAALIARARLAADAADAASLRMRSGPS